MKSGFTLIEILVVLSVIGLLTAAFGISASVYLAQMSNRKAEAQLSLICGAIEAYDRKEWTKMVSTVGANGVVRQVQLWPLWDMDNDSILDGTQTTLVPDTAPDDDSLAQASLPPKDYLGFVTHTRFRHNPDDLNPRGELLDPWHRPWRIALRCKAMTPADWHARFGGGTAGETMWYAIWSTGPDGINGNADDITSWKHHD